MTNEKRFALLRIAFGLVWAIDAAFKWQPAFLNNLLGQIDSSFWMSIIGHAPSSFALLIALAESAIALGLIFGFLTRSALIGSIILPLLIWSATGFGGPYLPGSTDIGASIIYPFVALGLYFGAAWQTWSVDALLAKRRLTKT